MPGKEKRGAKNGEKKGRRSARTASIYSAVSLKTHLTASVISPPSPAGRLQPQTIYTSPFFCMSR